MSITPIVELRFGTPPYYDVLSIEMKKKMKYNFINVFFPKLLPTCNSLAQWVRA